MSNQREIKFTNNNPLEFDNLGEIDWIAPQFCENCGKINKKDIGFNRGLYDGYRWESPFCKKCGKTILGVPKNEVARNVFLNRRPERKKILDLLKSA